MVVGCSPDQSADPARTTPIGFVRGSGRTRLGPRLAELVAAFSLATDLGLGQPMEHVLRSWGIAARLGEHIGIEPDDRGALYYVATLAWVGCVADTPEVATWFGDDIAFRRDSYEVDFAGLPMLGFMLRHVGAGSPALQRLRLAANLVVTGGKGIERGLMSHCLTTARMAERLGLGDDVCEPLQQVFTRWDGKGVPGDVGGERYRAARCGCSTSPTPSRCTTAPGDVDAAVEVARAGAASTSTPTVVDAFCARRRRRARRTRRAEPTGRPLIDAEPSTAATPHRGPSSTRALEAIADFTDLRSRVTGRPLPRRRRARRARGRANVRPPPTTTSWPLRRAGAGARPRPARDPGHDPRQARPAHVGTESERMRMHSVLHRADAGPATGPGPHRRHRVAHPRALRRVRLPPRSHRRARSRPPARLLAAACAFQAMTEPRAYRPALTAQAGGRRAARRRPRRSPRRRRGRRGARRRRPAPRASGAAGPAGLTPREIEVLTLIARGASTRQVAQALGDHPQDGRDPHRADLRQDRRLDPLDGHAVRHAARPARHARTARSVGRTPDDAAAARPYGRSRQRPSHADERSRPWPARQSSA